MAHNEILTLATISTWHIVAVLVVALLLFGGKKLPELARGVAKGMRIFRDELHGIQRDIEEPPVANASKPAAEEKPAATTPTEEKKA